MDALVFPIENGKKREEPRREFIRHIYILIPKRKLCFLNGAGHGDVVL